MGHSASKIVAAGTLAQCVVSAYVLGHAMILTDRLPHRTTIRSIWATVSIASLLGCASAPTRGGVQQLRVMSYNIEYGHEGLDSVAGVIRSQHPDIVGLQEVDVHWSERSNFVDQAAVLAARTGMNYRFAHIYEIAKADPSKPPREFGVALLSKYPIFAFTNHEITRHSTQDTTATVPMPGLLEAMVNVNGQIIRVFNVHLDYRREPDVRKKQVSEILSYILGDAGMIILTGDLNATPDAPELQPLLSQLHDTWPKSADPGLTFSSTKLEKKIDYVLLSNGLCPKGANVPHISGSDHFPMVVDLEIEATCKPR